MHGRWKPAAYGVLAGTKTRFPSARRGLEKAYQTAGFQRYSHTAPDAGDEDRRQMVALLCPLRNAASRFQPAAVAFFDGGALGRSGTESTTLPGCIQDGLRGLLFSHLDFRRVCCQSSVGDSFSASSQPPLRTQPPPDVRNRPQLTPPRRIHTHLRAELQMDHSLKSVHENMIRLDLGALAHANWTSAFFSWESDVWSELSVVQAAHAAEILIKARIALEHPLLIFERIPRLDAGGKDLLSFEKLLTEGRTYQYVDLPHRLWATTGIVLPSTDNFLEFGRLRNAIQHFATSLDIDLSQRTLDFIFSVIDPFINSCWGYFAIDYWRILNLTLISWKALSQGKYLS